MSRALGLLGLVLGLGCTSSQPAPSATTPAPSTLQADADATAEPTGRTESAEPAEPASAPTPSTAAIPTGPAAFVLYTLEQTVVIPLDGSEPLRGEGLWVQNDRAAPPSLSQTMLLSPSRIERMGLPACPCGNLDGGCTRGGNSTAHFDPATGAVTPESEAECRCVHPEPSWGMLPPSAADADGEVFEPCLGESAKSPVSLIGGRLYWLGWDWNGACYGGLSVYDSYELADELAPPVGPEDVPGMRAYGCTYELDGMPDEIPLWPLPDSLCRPTDGDECSCMDDDYFESKVFTLRRGWIWEIEDEVSHAGGSRRVARARARPDRCPSVNDPCGDPKPFGALPKGRRREFWGTTDGAALLSATGHRYQLRLRDAEDDAPPIRFELPGVHATTDVIGIRQHADVGPLLAAMRRHARRGTTAAAPVDEGTCVPPTLAPADATFVDTRGGRDWGNRCFTYVQLRDWNAAEAACLRGLEMATDDRTRGALLYNLGRVAEGRGLPEKAMEQYRRSLAVRPGNKAVRKRLATLERKHPNTASSDDP